MEIMVKIGIICLVAIVMALLYIAMIGTHRPIYVHRQRYLILTLMILLAIDLIFLYLKYDIHL
jgi:hypothetical protein